MKKFLALTATSVLAIASLNVAQISARGASFPAPLYSLWIGDYNKAAGVEINYTPTGSGDGIKSIKKRIVNFAGSDKPLKPKKLTKYKLYMFPTVIGSIVLAYNIDGIKDGELKLSRSAITAIFSGKAKFWDNDIIKKDNPNLKLPHTAITTCVRADKSGTTYNFTYFLNKIDSSFKVSKKPNWKAAKVVAGKSNAGVTANIKQIVGSIGYIEYSYKLKEHLAAAQVQNRVGKFVAPTVKSFTEGAKYAKWSAKNDFYALIGDPEGKSSYPIIAATFILLPKEKVDTNKEVVKFFNWAFKNGDKSALNLGYVPLPKETKDEIRAYWRDKGIF
jgi:phosphate transport system substrate-binding protein